MGFDRSALGILSPLVAVLGDIVVALALAYFVIVPLRLFVRRLTRRVERAAWQRVLDAPARTGLARLADARRAVVARVAAAVRDRDCARRATR